MRVGRKGRKGPEWRHTVTISVELSSGCYTMHEKNKKKVYIQLVSVESA